MSTISSIQPNLRFGTSLLDTKYRDRAVNGESLMDKRTGEIAFKRISDGSVIYHDREKSKLDDMLVNIKSLITSEVNFKYPTPYTMSDVTDRNRSFFIRTILDLQDFTPSTEPYCYGGVYTNNQSNGFTINPWSNGIFFKLMSRPRDIGVIKYCSSIYNRIVEEYSGTEGDILNEKKLYERYPTYKKSDAKITYQVVYTDKQGSKILDTTNTAYVEIDTESLILLPNVNFKEESLLKVSIFIKSIELPKMKRALDYIADEDNCTRIFKGLVDDSTLNEKVISLTHLFVSSFTLLNEYTSLPTEDKNVTIIDMVQLPAFLDAMEVVENVASINGISVSSEEPSKEKIHGLNVWVEKFRTVDSGRVTESISGSNTSFDKIEKFFGRVKSISGNITTDRTLLDDFFIEIYGELSNYDENTFKW